LISDELLERLVGARDVGERRLGHVLADELGLALAELHDAVAAALHLVHEEEQQAQDQQDRQEADEQRDQQALVVDLDVVGDLGAGERVGELPALVEQEGRADLRLALDGAAVRQRQADLLLLVQHLHRVGLARLDVAGLDRRQDGGGVDALVLAVPAQGVGQEQQGEQTQQEVEEGAAGEALEVHRCEAGSPVPPGRLWITTVHRAGSPSTSPTGAGTAVFRSEV
jgi:hypothetical protein